MTGYFETPLTTLYKGDVRAVCAGLPEASVHMVVTSPPYWGLRIYDGSPLIWGGKPDCSHQWEAGRLVHDNLRFRGEGSVVSNNLNEAIRPGSEVGDHTCKLCGAWLGFYGLEATPELYVEHTVEILRALRRVLRPDGLIFWNIGDNYCGGNRVTDKAQGLSPDNARDLPLDYRPSRAMAGHPTIKPKDLVLIPFRVALAAQADGWVVRSDIIWTKPNGMPESVDDRPGHTHEYILMLAQSNKPTFWTHREQDGVRQRPKADWRWVNRLTGEEATAPPANWKEKIPCPDCAGTGEQEFTIGFGKIKERCDSCDGKGVVKLWRRINLWEAHDYFYDNEAVRIPYTEPLNRWGGDTWKKGSNKAEVYAEENYIGTSSARRPGRDIRPNENGRNLRSVWEIPTVAYSGAHFAVFPPELPETCIKAGTSGNGVCSVCGAPYNRQLKVKGTVGDSASTHSKTADEVQVSETSAIRTKVWKEYETVGWLPTCGCGAERVPATVLDPFGGSGTTAEVAGRLGRRAILIEQSGKYCDLAVGRLQQGVLPLI